MASEVIYAVVPADVAVNSTTDITVGTVSVTSVAANDQILVEIEFQLLNNSAATRAMVFSLDFGGITDVEHTTGALATSATLEHPFFYRGLLSVRSSSLAYAVFTTEGQLAAGIASGDDTTMAATHLRAMGWETTTSNLTGTVTVNFKIRSPSATATQTCRLHKMVVRKVTP